MRKFKKMYGARLELKESEWLEAKMKANKQTSSIIIRDLIRNKIAMEAALQPKPMPSQTAPTYNPLAGKTVADWFKQNQPKQEEVTQ